MRKIVLWTEEELSLLGKVPDPELASKMGVAKETIQKKRASLGIPSARKSGIISEKQKAHLQKISSSGVWIDWDDAAIAKLGTAPDIEIARQLGTTNQNVAKKRAKLGIPSHRSAKTSSGQPNLQEWNYIQHLPQSEFIKTCCSHAGLTYKELAARCYVSHSRMQKWAAPGSGQEPLSMAYRRLIYLETHR